MRYDPASRDSERALRESEELFRSLFEQAAVGIAQMGLDGRWLRANEKFCAILGYSSEELTRRRFHDLTYPEDVEPDQRRLAELLSGKIAKYSIEKRDIRKDGTVIWVNVTRSLIRDRRGKPEYIITIIEEIGLRKRVEEQLRESQKMLRLVLDAIPVRVFWKDKKSTYLGCNHTFAEDVGLSGPDECRGKTDYDFNKRETERYRADDRNVMESGVPKLNYEESQTSADGSRTWLRTSKIPLRDEKGEIYGVLGTYENITAWKRAEEELQKNSSILTTIMESTPDFIFLKDAGGRYVLVNSATTEAFGKKRSDFIGKRDSEIFPPHIVRAIDDVDRRVLETGKSFEYEETIPIHGVPRVLLTAKSVCRDSRGRVIGLVGVSRDISERKQAEEVVKRDKDTFERLVQERTRALLEARVQLEKTQRLSDIGMLATTVAHELRNPLAAISIADMNIRRKEKNPRLDSHLRTIEKKVNESDQIINNLLFYSRLKAPNIERVRLYDLLEESVETARTRFAGITVELLADRMKGVEIEADPQQLKEVFTNILNNAADAVKGKEGGRIEVDAGREAGWVKLLFKDNGTGMTEETRQKAFEPFYTTKSKGTGLGLPVCRQIVEMLDGTIHLESTKGKGTTVIVRLPLKE